MRSWLSIGTLAALLSSGAAAHGADRAECKAAAEDGQALRDSRKLGEARARFAVCAQQDCPDPIRSDCAGWLEEVDARRPTVVLVARGARGEDLIEVLVTSGGRELARRLEGGEVALDPGAYTLRFEAPGLPPQDKRVVVADGQKRRTIEVTLAAAAADTAPRPSSGPGVAPWVLVGVAGAGLTAFAVLQGVARSEKSDLEDGCGREAGCPDADLDPVRAQFVASGIALGVGGAAVLGAAALFLFHRRDAPSARATRVVPEVSPSGLGVRLRVPISF